MNKLLGLTLMFVSWGSIAWLTSNGFGNYYAGLVLTFACGMLAGHVGRTR